MIAFEISRKSQNQSSSLTSTVEEATKSISGQGVETLIMKQRLLFKEKKNLMFMIVQIYTPKMKNVL